MDVVEEIRQLVQQKVANLERQQESRRPQLEEAQRNLIKEKEGLQKSFRDPDLTQELRAELMKDFSEILEQLRKTESELANETARQQALSTAVDSAMIEERLNRLPEVLGRENPTDLNVELAQLIDRIVINLDETVLIRGCILGLAPPAIGLLNTRENDAATAADEESTEGRIRPQRRVRRRVEDRDAADWATDVDRFRGLPEECFWEVCLRKPPKELGWFAQNALDVAKYRIEHRATFDETAKHFGVAVPTIRKAVLHAKELGIDASDAALRLPRKKDWAKEHAPEVAAYFRSGRSMTEAVQHFGRSDTTLRKARDIAAAREREGQGSDEEATGSRA